MACTSIIPSSSSSQTIRYYDVFVSFRGDTRYGFTNHLFAALHRRGILTFRDDKNLRKGEAIGPELLHAIEGSRVFIVVFSKDFASSTWCLRELAKIVDYCLNGSSTKHVLPVFYDVDPSEVRKQSGNFGEAFAKHEERFKQDLDMVQTWKAALTQVANLSGWDVRDKPQSAVIENIVEETISLLGLNISNVPNDIVGWESPVEELEKLLRLGSDDDVRVVGICGIGGIGKTTLTHVLYNKISHQYPACCFIDDVSKIYRDDGSIGAQKQLLSQTLKPDNLQINNHCDTVNLIRTRLRHIKGLIVLDNVDQLEQLEKLSVKREWLGAGSRIIIISRDEHILRNYGVDVVYNVQLLNHDNALQLFCRKAFKCDDFKSDYMKLTYDALEYADGHPLAIKVLGSFLSGKNVSEWRSALARLREEPEGDIMNVLRISYDGLKDSEKGIFLDIACFFSYGKMDETYVRKILDIRGFYPDIGIRVLLDKSLITRGYEKIFMHDLLIELGKSIVRGKSPKEPRKWSRLWDYKDLHNVMSENKGRPKGQAIKALALGFKKVYLHYQKKFSVGPLYNVTSAISVGLAYVISFSKKKIISKGLTSKFVLGLNRCWADPAFFTMLQASNNLEAIAVPYKFGNISMRADALSQMTRLNLLIISGEKFSGRLSYLSNELRYIDWEDYPFTCLPSSFEPDKLVELILRNSNIKQLCEGTKSLYKLRHMDLSDSKNLTKLPDFRAVPNLEHLNLEGCIKLQRIDPSIGLLKKLVFFNLKHCKNLVSVPINILGISSLEFLYLRGCSNLKMFDASEIGMDWQSTSSSCNMLMPNNFFYPTRHEEPVGLLLPLLPNFPCLRDLDLSYCNLLQIPDSIGSLHYLEKLNLEGNHFVTLTSIEKLSKLAYLNLMNCKQLKYLPELPSITVLPARREHFFGRYGLYIFNCPSLCEPERCCRMTFCWMIQVIELRMQSSLPFHVDYGIVIPGSQIPRWLNKQSVGNTIRLDPPPIMHDDNHWIGILCCAIFVKPVNFDIQFHLTKPGREYGPGSEIWIELGEKPYTAQSDHLVLVFFDRQDFTHQLLSDITGGTNDLVCVDENNNVCGDPSSHVEVKNIGYRWVFKEDLQQLNTTMHRNSSKRKFLTIDDEPHP